MVEVRDTMDDEIRQAIERLTEAQAILESIDRNLITLDDEPEPTLHQVLQFYLESIDALIMALETL